MSQKKSSIAEGLQALLETSGQVPISKIPYSHFVPPILSLTIDQLAPSRFQPRKQIDDAALFELVQSIRTEGILQPLLVRKTDVGYEILAGERRWRAAQLAELSEVPVLVREVTDDSAFAIALIENLQREELNPIDEAEALLQLLQRLEITHAKLGEMIGKSRVYVSNSLRLIDCADFVKQCLRERQLEMGHARCLLALDKLAQVEAAKEVLLKQYTVRQTERLVQGWHQAKQTRSFSFANEQIEWARLLESHFGTSVQLNLRRDGKHSFTVKYESARALQAFISRLQDEKQIIQSE